MSLKIVSPSKGRFNNYLTKEVINDIIIVCPHSELDLYKEFNPNNEIIAAPKDAKGIVKTRQWILDQFDEVFMVDDDVEYVRRMYTEENEPYKITDPNMVNDIIHQNADVCKQMGAKMFGFGSKRQPKMYDSFKPIKYTGYINASYCGYLKGHGLKYNTTLIEGEDHYMSALNVFKHRKMHIDTRYSFFTKDNFKASGGCGDYRTLEDMKNTTIELRSYFGEAIRMKQPNTGKKEVNEGERSLKFPF